MGKLTAEQIAFIDRYLENSGIDYFDVRLEAADHIASAIEQLEGDFYTNFRLYMAQHKAELLASCKKQETEMLKMAAGQFFMTAAKPQWLVLFLLFAVGVAGVTNIAGVATSLTILEYTYMGMSATVGLHYLYNFFCHKRKFFMTWTMLSCNYIAVVWILWIFNFQNILEAITPYLALVYYTLLWYLFLVFYVMFFRVRKELVQRYKTA